MITKGTGFPVVVLPGLQGRWEWLTPTIEALTAGHRVIGLSLTELRPVREDDSSFLAWMHALDEALDRAHERRVSIIGVSFGGLIAACYAARRPERVTSLVMVAPPSPVWEPRPGDEFCLKYPRLAMPYFGVRAMSRLLPEIHRARPVWSQRWRLGMDYALRSVRAPLRPAFAAQWVREWHAFDISDECARIIAPTLLVTGEPGLDKVVPVERSRQYLKLIPGATHMVLADTGHIGVITKPYRFAEIAGPFIYGANSAERNPPRAEEQARHVS
jgi:pimeloyl-ACP methyl ester carboxylesterase